MGSVRVSRRRPALYRSLGGRRPEDGRGDPRAAAARSRADPLPLERRGLLDPVRRPALDLRSGEPHVSHPAPGELIVYPGGFGVRDPDRLRRGRLLEQGRPAWRQPLRDARPTGREQPARDGSARPLGGRPGSDRGGRRQVELRTSARPPWFDRLVRGGTVVTAAGSRQADVAIRGGRIVGRRAGHPGRAPRARSSTRPACWSCPASSTSTPTPGSRATTEPDRFFQDSVAAAFGGTTTFLAFNNPGTGSAQTAQRTLARGHRASGAPRLAAMRAIDFGLSRGASRPSRRTRRRHRRGCRRRASPTFKCFMVYDFGVDEARLRGRC